MKNFLIISLVLLLTTINKSLAQQPKPGDYLPNLQNKKFEGTWSFSNPNVELKIKLVNKEKVIVKGFDIYVDNLEGYITYLKDGETILKNANIIKGGICNPRNLNAFNAVLNDPNGKGGKVYAIFENENDQNTLTLSITLFPKASFEVQDKRPLRMPEKIILKRIE